MRIWRLSVFILLFIAFVLRMTLVFFTTDSLYEHNDSFLHRDWGKIAFLYGPSETYRSTYISDVGIINNLPPGATYIFGSMYFIHVQASKVINIVTGKPPGNFLWMNDGTFANIFLRFPAVVADILIGYLIYRVVRVHSRKRALLAMSLYVFNPAVIYLSSVWGQIDSIPVLLFLSGLYFMGKQRYIISLILIGLSLYVKLSVLPLIPLYLYFLIRQVSPIRLLKYSMIVMLIITVLTIPISVAPIQWIWEFSLKNTSNVLNNITANAYNFWWFVLAPKLLVPATTVSTFFLGLPLSVWAYTLFTISSFPLFYVLYRTPSLRLRKSELLFCLFSLQVIVYFMFLPSMHERYLFPLMSMLPIAIAVTNKKWWVIVVMSVIYVVNIFSVWQYRVPEADIRSNLVLTNQLFSWLLSVTFVGTSIFYYVATVRKLLEKKEH